jgi:hypothetical protein
MTDQPQRWVSGLAQGDQPLPGSFGLSRIGGLLGKLIAAGQAFSGDASRWTHAFVVLDDQWVIEAMPGGARLAPLADRLNHAEVVFSDKPVQLELEALRQRIAHLELTDPEAYWNWATGTYRVTVVENARRLEGVGYGYLQYLALGLVAVGFQPKWLRKYIASKGRMICSQLVDEVYRRSGIHLFDDDRLPQDVTPGDLAIWAGIS